MSISARKIEILYFLIIQAGLLATWQHAALVRMVCSYSRAEQETSFEPPPKIKRTKPLIPFNVSYGHIEQREGEQFLDGVVVRAFADWPKDVALPCGEYPMPKRWHHPKVMRSPTKEGYLFVKEMKTGSSTVGGVVLRIARNVARRKEQPFMCVNRIDHTAARDMEYINRDKARSFLFTVLRNPQKRVTSQFFHFFVSREKIEPTDANFEAFLKRMPYMRDYYLKDLALIDSDNAKLRKFIKHYDPLEISDNMLQSLRLKLANSIMRGYDFIAITERMDESLVVLKMILRLKISDILYIKAKSSGGFDDGAFNGTCTFIVPSFVSPGMKNFFKTDEYLNRTEGDWMLYRAASKSLDMTIDRLGREQVEQHVLEFRAAQKMANDRCSLGIRYPCTQGGVRAPYNTHNAPEAHDCLWLDSACGYECLDRISPEVEDMIESGQLLGE